LGFFRPNDLEKQQLFKNDCRLSKPTSGDIKICGYSIEEDYVSDVYVGCMIESPIFMIYTELDYRNLEN